MLLLLLVAAVASATCDEEFNDNLAMIGTIFYETATTKSTETARILSIKVINDIVIVSRRKADSCGGKMEMVEFIGEQAILTIVDTLDWPKYYIAELKRDEGIPFEPASLTRIKEHMQLVMSPVVVEQWKTELDLIIKYPGMPKEHKATAHSLLRDLSDGSFVKTRKAEIQSVRGLVTKLRQAMQVMTSFRGRFSTEIEALLGNVAVWHMFMIRAHHELKLGERGLLGADNETLEDLLSQTIDVSMPYFLAQRKMDGYASLPTHPSMMTFRHFLESEESACDIQQLSIIYGCPNEARLVGIHSFRAALLTPWGGEPPAAAARLIEAWVRLRFDTQVDLSRRILPKLNASIGPVKFTAAEVKQVTAQMKEVEERQGGGGFSSLIKAITKQLEEHSDKEKMHKAKSRLDRLLTLYLKCPEVRKKTLEQIFELKNELGSVDEEAEVDEERLAYIDRTKDRFINVPLVAEWRHDLARITFSRRISEATREKALMMYNDFINPEYLTAIEDRIDSLDNIESKLHDVLEFFETSCVTYSNEVGAAIGHLFVWRLRLVALEAGGAGIGIYGARFAEILALARRTPNDVLLLQRLSLGLPLIAEDLNRADQAEQLDAVARFGRTAVANDVMKVFLDVYGDPVVAKMVAVFSGCAELMNAKDFLPAIADELNTIVDANLRELVYLEQVSARRFQTHNEDVTLLADLVEYVRVIWMHAPVGARSNLLLGKASRVVPWTGLELPDDKVIAYIRKRMTQVISPGLISAWLEKLKSIKGNSEAIRLINILSDSDEMKKRKTALQAVINFDAIVRDAREILHAADGVYNPEVEAILGSLSVLFFKLKKIDGDVSGVDEVMDSAKWALLHLRSIVGIARVPQLEGDANDSSRIRDYCLQLVDTDILAELNQRFDGKEESSVMLLTLLLTLADGELQGDLLDSDTLYRLTDTLNKMHHRGVALV